MLMRFLAFTLSFSVLGAAASAAPKLINDELVQNLDCSRLSPNQIYSSIKLDSLNWSRRFPIWNYHTLTMKGHCWAIARFDRLALLLGRLESDLPPISREKLVNMATVVEFNKLPYLPLAIKSEKRTPLEVFQWPQVSSDSGYKEVLASNVPSIKSELDRAQKHLFYRSQNLPFLFKSFSVPEKRSLFAQALRLTNGKRLPLLNLRFSATHQHVVVGIQVDRTSQGEFLIQTLDSNSSEGFITVRTSSTEFKAFYKKGVYSDEEEIDLVSVVEESERPEIDRALMGHYQRLCR